MIGAGSEYVSNKIKGEEGTKVKVTIERNGEYLDFDIERKAIKVYHVETEMLENNIGYIDMNNLWILTKHGYHFKIKT